jgi:hypothetical protein
MHNAFAPMSSRTLQFAKAYRAEQIRAAEQSRMAADFKKSRRGTLSGILAAITDMGGRTRRPQSMIAPSSGVR